ncbi:MAG: hypothetical protein JHC64_23485 [Mycolicibacterium sp.]|nr:hypothetical protein [Mycolicibacterium sp.]
MSTVGAAGAIALVAVTGVACSSGSTTATSSSSSSSVSSSASATSKDAAPVDYTTLLIKPEDIVIPGDTFTASEPQLNPSGAQGVAVGFNNADQTRSIGDSIVVLPDAAAAKTAMDGAVAALDQSIADPAPQPAEVGTNGVVATGTAPDGSKAVTVVVFTQGTAFVVMEFDSAAGDPVPVDFATSLAQKQADAIKSGLG